MRAARGCGQRRCQLSQWRVKNSVAGGRSSGGNPGWAEQSTCLFELCATGRTADAVVPHFGATARQRVQQEAVDELLGRQGDAVQLLAAIVTITKSDLPLLDALQPRVSDGHAKDVAGEIVEHLPALSCCLAMDQHAD